MKLRNVTHQEPVMVKPLYCLPGVDGKFKSVFEWLLLQQTQTPSFLLRAGLDWYIDSFLFSFNYDAVSCLAVNDAFPALLKSP